MARASGRSSAAEESLKRRIGACFSNELLDPLRVEIQTGHWVAQLPEATRQVARHRADLKDLAAAVVLLNRGQVVLVAVPVTREVAEVPVP